MPWTEADYRRTGREYAGHNVKRKKRRRKAKFLRRSIVVVFLVALIFCVKNVIGNQILLTGEGIVWKGGLEPVFDEAGEMSDTLRELVEHNPETADFVKNYMEKKDNPPAQSAEEVQAGVIPHFLQWDERWGYQIYGDNLIAVNGCGPTVLSMVAAGLTGDSTVTPYKVAKFAEKNGYYAGEAGTSWSLMTEGVRQFGIHGEEMGLSEEEIISALENGNPVICSMSPGDFTTTGHFIVLVGIEDGKIRVNDPNSVKRSEKLWDYATLEPQINNLWVYTVL